MASIKITELTDIAGNISTSTLVPVVDMTGIPTTDKANLEIVGNFILSQSGNGGALLPAAEASSAQGLSRNGNVTIEAWSGTAAISTFDTTGNLTLDGGTGYLIGHVAPAATHLIINQNYTATATDSIIFAASGGVTVPNPTITLPFPGVADGKTYTIINPTPDNIFVVAEGAATINDSNTPISIGITGGYITVVYSAVQQFYWIIGEKLV